MPEKNEDANKAETEDLRIPNATPEEVARSLFKPKPKPKPAKPSD